MSTSINPRMRPRIAVSIGSIQLSKRRSSVSFCSNGESDFVVALVMAWSPVRRVNAGRFEIKHPGDYATFNSNHSRDATLHDSLVHPPIETNSRNSPEITLAWISTARDSPNIL